jgi:hypothetical protein
VRLGGHEGAPSTPTFFFFFALLGTDAHFCEVVVLKLRTVPICTALPPTFSPSSHFAREMGFLEEARETGILLPNNQRQHRTSHAPKNVLPLRICAKYCAPCQPLLRAFHGWIRSPALTYWKLRKWCPLTMPRWKNTSNPSPLTSHPSPNQNSEPHTLNPISSTLNPEP